MPISNNFDALRIPYKMLAASGIWPTDNPTNIYRMNTILSWFFAIGLFVVLLIQLIYDINDFTKLSETLYIMASYLAFFIKIISFTYHRNEFKNLMTALQNPIFISYPEDLDHYMAKTVRLSIFYARFYQIGITSLILLLIIYPILDHKALPFPLPYDLGNYTILMYIFQIIGEIYSCINHSFLDVVYIALMGIIAAQLDILKEKITGFIKDDNDSESYEIPSYNENDEDLKPLVEHHLAIISIADAVENIFSITILGQFAASAIVLCNTIFNLVLIPLSSKFILLGDYLGVMMLQLYIYCWYGNEIIVKSLEIGDACYMSKWYMANNSARQHLFIMMERSKRPLRMTALGISSLSLTSFATILHWSYSYLALLLKLYSKQSTQLEKDLI